MKFDTDKTKKGIRIFLILGLILFSATLRARAEAWKPADGPLATRWAKDVSPSNALPEYPRPQMVRKEWLNLNGLWGYSIVSRKDGEAKSASEGKILVPYPVESALSGVMKRVDEKQLLIYRRQFETPKKWAGKRVLLHFGAVDWETTVWVNGKKLGVHRGGYDPFTFDITDALKKSGRQEILVSVWDPTDRSYQPRGKQVQKPESIWYTPTTGIWQTVWLEPVPKTHISSIKITPDIDGKAVEVTVTAGGGTDGIVAAAEIVLPNGNKGKKTVAASGAPGAVLKVALPEDAEPCLWSPDSPFLYGLNVKLYKGKATGAAIDSVASYVGMRKVSVEKDAGGVPRIFLNNKPLFMYGVLDQGFWPDGLYTAPTDEALRFDIETIKSFGFNMARKHVKVEPARWYYWCDKLGLLVWQDMPSGDSLMPPGRELKRSAESAAQYRLELQKMIDANINSPSIVVWVPFNEGWGQFDTVNVAEWVKRYDPTRLVDNASGWTDMKCGDIYDIHRYPEPDAPPIEASRAAVVGEFGGLGFTAQGHNWREGLERLAGKSDGAKNWGYREVQGSEQLWKQYQSLSLILGRLIRLKGLSAAVYTQITDVEIEVNGLVSYDREIFKFDTSRMAAENNKLYGAIEAGARQELKTVIPTAQDEKTFWRFTTKKPEDDWMKPDFRDDGWRKGAGGFGSIGGGDKKVETIWTTKQIWLRKEFEVPAGDCTEPILSLFHNESAEIYINGVLAAAEAGAVNSYVLLPISQEAAAAIKPEKNVIAATCTSGGAWQFFDAGLSFVCGK